MQCKKIQKGLELKTTHGTWPHWIGFQITDVEMSGWRESRNNAVLKGGFGGEHPILSSFDIIVSTYWIFALSAPASTSKRTALTLTMSWTSMFWNCDVWSRLLVILVTFLILQCCVKMLCIQIQSNQTRFVNIGIGFYNDSIRHKVIAS